MTLSDDNEHTVIASASGAAGEPHLHASGEYAAALPVSTRLHEFEILSVIGQGGFGIVYLAQDLALNRRVAIKEYMPSELAMRTRAMTVAVRSGRHAETFAAGMRSFVNEARLLAQFDHPSLLKVHRFWEGHGTAYMVMPYYAGVTLGSLLSQRGGTLDEAQLQAFVHPLLDALALLHAANCYHRDIAPDNILILPNGRPLLLDFGAARRVIGDMTHALTVILKTGYAPVEQYGELPDMAQGPWTDLYALGSVVHFAITGHTPPQALSRLISDKYQPLAVVAAGRYSDAFLKAVDRTLAVLPKNRPQNVDEMRALLGAASPVSMPSGVGAATFPVPAAAPSFTGPTGSATRVLGAELPPDRRTIMAATATLAVLAAAAGSYAWFSSRRHDGAGPTAPPVLAPAPSSVPAPSLSGAPAVRPPPAPMPPAAPTAESTTSARPSRDAIPASAVPERSLPGAVAPLPPLPSPQEARPARGAEMGAGAKLQPSVSAPAPRAAAAASPLPLPVPQAAVPPALPGQSTSTHRQLHNERCADIIQRASLGEEIDDADKALLKRECRS